MRIKYIDFENIGLYTNGRISLNSKKEKEIILFWGNNGAGKTTFINAVKVCLLGEKAFSFGYDEYCNFVKNQILSSRLNDNNKKASISICVDYKEDNRINEYLIKREWIINEDFTEELTVFCNERRLDYEEKDIIEKKINRILSPSLLDIIVFDGEKAINVLNDNHLDKMIKNLVYSVFGMDVYANLSKDLSAYLRSTNSQSEISTDNQMNFVLLESDYKSLNSRVNKTKQLLEKEKSAINVSTQRIKALSKLFAEKTGINMNEIKEFSDGISLKQSEKERINQKIKKINEEILPLKMLQTQLKIIVDEVDKNRKFQILDNFENVKEYFFNNVDAMKLLNQLEQYIPKGKEERKYRLTNEEYVALKTAYDTSLSYSKKELLSNYEIKSDYSDSLKESIRIAGLSQDEESKSILSEIEKEIEKSKKSSDTYNTLFTEYTESLEQLENAKALYEKSKKDLLLLKKETNSYISAFKYREAIDKFVKENVSDICNNINSLLLGYLKDIKFRNNSIVKVEISPNNFELRLYEKNDKVIQSQLFSDGEKQVLLGLTIKAALSSAKIDTFFLFDTPVGRLDTKNRKVFTNEVIFKITDQVLVFATDSDYSLNDYSEIKDKISKEYCLERNEYDEIIAKDGGFYK